MAFGKWNDVGSTDYVGSSTLYARQLNDTIGSIAPPIGTIIGWAKSFTGVPGNNLFGCWLECNGSTISDGNSPLNGQVLPTLNPTGSFLRGNSTSGTVGGVTAHSHNLPDSNDNTDNIDTRAPDDYYAAGDDHEHTLPSVVNNNVPKHYEVVFIMRIK